jgi:sugar-specific transcriptional regulator TrmB
MAEKIIGRPEEFKATPAEQAVSILISRKQNEIQQLAKTAGSLVKKYAENRARPVANPDCFRFIELPERGSILAEILEKTKDKTWKTLDIVSSWNRVTRWLVVCQKEISQTLDRGVKIRLVVGKPTETTGPTLMRLDNLKRTKEFTYKLLCFEPRALLNIKDNDEVHLNLNPSPSGAGGFGRCLFSNHPAFIGLARTYFDSLWTNAYTQQ